LAARGRGRDRRSLEAARSLSRVDACNPPTASAPDLGAGRTRRPRDSHLSHVGLRPPRSPPFALALALDLSGLGHAATFTRRPRDPRSRNADNLIIFVLIHMDNKLCHICVRWINYRFSMGNKFRLSKKLCLLKFRIPVLEILGPRQSDVNEIIFH
jgi:hypothetical protein